MNDDTDEDIDRDMIRRLEELPVDPDPVRHEHTIDWHKEQLLAQIGGGSAFLLMAILCALLEGC